MLLNGLLIPTFKCINEETFKKVEILCIKVSKSILDKIEKYIDEMSLRKSIPKYSQPALVVSKSFHEYLKNNFPDKFNF